MIVRRLTAQEHTQASPISAIAFHIRIENMEERIAEWVKNEAAYKNNDWGAFTDDGEIMAHIINDHFTTWLDGTPVKNSGVGAVSTLPEFRNSGAVRSMFGPMLKSSRDEGALISTLYPFNHAFYRKFGYETACYSMRYTIPAAALTGFRHDGWVKMWHPGEARDYFTGVYNAFAKNYNLAFLRDEDCMSNHVRGEYYKDRRFSYLIGDTENGPTAYVVFEDESEKDGHIIHVTDMAYTSPFGLRCLLGFLARFSADYESISLRLPMDIDLRSLVSEPYDIKNETMCDYMVRALNVPQLLSIKKKPDTPFTLSVTDDLLPENTGTYLVKGPSVEKTDAPADIELSIQAFSQLITGAVSFDEALYRADVTLNSNAETLRAAFPKKTLYVSDHF